MRSTTNSGTTRLRRNINLSEQDKKSNQTSSTGPTKKKRRRRRRRSNKPNNKQVDSPDSNLKKNDGRNQNNRSSNKSNRHKNSGNSSKNKKSNQGQPRRRGGQGQGANQSKKKSHDKLRYSFSEGSFKLDPIHALNIGKDFNPDLQSFKNKKQKVVFFETVVHAIAQKEMLEKLSKEVEQLNIVIKAEGDRSVPELVQYGKVFRGEAWTIIHERRVEDEFYKEKQAAVEA